MPNPISNAIGTQRQFSKQPERVYEKRLIEPSFGRGISIGANGDAQSLANSLGLLGKGIFAESLAEDKRREKVGEAEADRIFAVTSEKDKEKLATLDILGRSDKFDLTDNPYAIARIDELRGQHLNSLFKNEYEQTVLPNQDLAQNSQANIKNYEDFMAQKLKDADVTIYNRTAFDKGFYKSRPMDIIQQDANYRKRRQADLEAQRNAAIGSKIDDVIAKSLNMSGDEVASELQDIQLDEMLTGVDKATRIKLLNSIGKGLATNGNTEQLSAWGETIAYYDLNNNEPVRVKNLMPMGELTKMADDANVHLNEQKTRDFLKSLEDIPSAALADKFDELKAKDPLFWKSVAPMQKNLYAQKQREEKKAIKEAAKKQEALYKTNAVNYVLDSRFEAFRLNKPMDTYGSLMNSKQITIGGKTTTITEDELMSWGQGRLVDWGQQVQAGTLSRVDAAKNSMQLLAFPQMSGLAKAQKQNNAMILSSLNPAALVRDATGAMKLPERVDEMLNMYDVDKATFETIFGEEQTADVATLADFVKVNGEAEGVSKFAVYKENKNNPDFRKFVNQTVTDKLGDDMSGTVALHSLGANGDSDTINFNTNPVLEKSLRLNLEAGLYSGMTANDAYDNAEKRVMENYMSFKGCAFPKSFVYNVPSEYQEKHVAAFLQSEYQKEADSYGEAGLRFLYAAGSLQLWRGGNMVKSWNNISIADAVGKWYENIPEEEKVKVDDVYYNPTWDNTNYYLSNPDAATEEQAQQQAGITSPIGALMDALGGVFR